MQTNGSDHCSSLFWALQIKIYKAMQVWCGFCCVPCWINICPSWMHFCAVLSCWWWWWLFWLVTIIAFKLCSSRVLVCCCYCFRGIPLWTWYQAGPRCIALSWRTRGGEQRNVGLRTYPSSVCMKCNSMRRQLVQVTSLVDIELDCSCDNKAGRCFPEWPSDL